MKKKEKKKEQRPAREKKADESDKKLAGKKKNLKIRKEALKKIFNHFNDPDKQGNHEP